METTLVVVGIGAIIRRIENSMGDVFIIIIIVVGLDVCNVPIVVLVLSTSRVILLLYTRIIYSSTRVL